MLLGADGCVMTKTVQIDEIDHDTIRDEVFGALQRIEDDGQLATAAHAHISAAVMVMLERFELSSIIDMLRKVEDVATEAASGMAD